MRQVYKFDQASTLSKQMAAYGKKHGQNYIHMRFHFPFDYPVNPPFVHVKSPKLMGGSIHTGGICTDILMNGPSPLFVSLLLPFALTPETCTLCLALPSISTSCSCGLPFFVLATCLTARQGRRLDASDHCRGTDPAAAPALRRAR